jgi:hypothetical protein
MASLPLGPNAHLDDAIETAAAGCLI